VRKCEVCVGRYSHRVIAWSASVAGRERDGIRKDGYAEEPIPEKEQKGCSENRTPDLSHPKRELYH